MHSLSFCWKMVPALGIHIAQICKANFACKICRTHVDFLVLRRIYLEKAADRRPWAARLDDVFILESPTLNCMRSFAHLQLSTLKHKSGWILSHRAPQNLSIGPFDSKFNSLSLGLAKSPLYDILQWNTKTAEYRATECLRSSRRHRSIANSILYNLGSPILDSWISEFLSLCHSGRKWVLPHSGPKWVLPHFGFK